MQSDGFRLGCCWRSSSPFCSSACRPTWLGSKTTLPSIQTVTVGEFTPGERLWYTLHGMKVMLVGRLDDSRLCRVVNEIGDRFLLSCDVPAKPIVRVCRIRGRS